MAAALLAKLKLNKPPLAKRVFEINIPGMREREDKVPKLKEPRDNVDAEKAVAEDAVPAEKKEPKQVKFIDDTKGFDRDTFLKTFKRPKLLNAEGQVPAQGQGQVPEPVPAQGQEPTLLEEPSKKNTTRKKIIKKSSLKPKVVIATEEELAPAVAATKEPAIAAAATAAATEEPSAAAAEKPKKITIRRTKKTVVGVKEGPLAMMVIGDADIETRLKKKRDALPIIPASSYYMNNREIFVSFMSSLFNKYKKKLATEAATPATCPGDNDVNDFSLMTHQEIVRDYLNLYSPYRGLLLYHGLGSGKTCSSIAIAEGLKTTKPVIIMTPASLQGNYREELKKCGDELYRKNQFWEFIPYDDKATELMDTLSGVLSLPAEYIKKNKGAWLVNMSKPSNYDQLPEADKVNVDAQIDKMIAHKYRFINYNGLRATKVLEMTHDNTINPFDNSVVIIDEAHNLVSRIVNKLGQKQGTIAITLYELLMKAKNAKIVLLSGTPIINYPNEISILFNILRGYITSWTFKLDIREQRQVDTAYFRSLLKSTVLGGNVTDLIDYKASNTTLVITRNPFGFVNKTAAKDNSYTGVQLDVGDRGEISDDTFIKLVTQLLKKNNINIQANGMSIHQYKALPDKLEEFKEYFIDGTAKLKNDGMFKRRILGLTSYFRSAQESLMPRYTKTNPQDFQVIKIPMSDFQFGVYEEARVQERKLELRNAKNKKVKQAGADNLYEKTTSTYRIFSRAFCNFVFPKPAIMRPMPDKKNKVGEEMNLEDAVVAEMIDEDVLDAVGKDEKLARDEEIEDADELDANAEGVRGNAEGVRGNAEGAQGNAEGKAEGKGVPGKRITYKDRIHRALAALEKAGTKYLTPEALEIYSPKFLHILENIQDEAHSGIHLIYSQFRSLEGIGILKLILEANGFTQFKIKKVGETWDLAIPEADLGKPTFALYTGLESREEKEIVRNVLNNSWKYVPEPIVQQIKAISPNNNLGEIIKVFMITSSGAEGISLKNVRYVHITEPYWHPVRMEQVIGRARRICSHQALPKELRTVTVFLYLMTFSEKQLKSDDTLELRLHDKSRIDSVTPVSTDESLYEIASAKEAISTNILKAVKEASIDCALHVKSNTSEKLQCFTFGSNDSGKFAYVPAFENEQSDAIADKNKKEVTWKAKELELDGVKYAYNPKTGEIYDLDSYQNGQPVKIGDVNIKGKGKTATFEVKFI